MFSVLMGSLEWLALQAPAGHIARIFPKFYVSQLPVILVSCEEETSMEENKRSIYARQFTAVMDEMTAWYSDTTRYVNHFLKVWAFARHIGLSEGLSEETQFLLEVTALMHDIGIKPAKEKYGSSAGNYLELEGPGAARPILERHGFTLAQTERICYLIGRHHTYKDMDGLDYQILVEADFLVNIFEEGHSRQSIESVREKIFRTASGRKLLDTLYLAPSGRIPAEHPDR